MPPKIHVVAGILFNERGEFLLSSRPEGKPYAGYWEFAGGKVEAGETEFAALQREFMEELGIEITHATPWLAKFYRYEHAHVNLRFFRVAAHEWRGKLQAREQQQWAWQKAGDFTVSPMLPANTALLAQLAIPSAAMPRANIALCRTRWQRRSTKPCGCRWMLGSNAIGSLKTPAACGWRWTMWRSFTRRKMPMRLFGA